MAFTAADVKNLRERTGCGMMACKEALDVSEGNVEKAIEYLREKGLAQQAKKSGRVAAEGLVLAQYDETKKVGTVVEVNIETDFAAKNESFVELVHEAADTVMACNPADVDALMACTIPGKNVTLEQSLQEKFLVIRENMKVRRFVRLEGNMVTYVHGGGRIAVAVCYEADPAIADKEEVKACVKDIAMQVAAMNPAYLDQTNVPAEIIEQEKEVLIAQIKNDPKNASKPEAIVHKMVDGRIGKYYKENCLLEQEFVKDSSMDVAGYVNSVAKAVGGSLKITSYTRFERGEGIAKKEDDFAAEVQSMVK